MTIKYSGTKKAAFGEAALYLKNLKSYNINSFRANSTMPLKKSFLYT
jgi:hypothetical protein